MEMIQDIIDKSINRTPISPSQIFKSSTDAIPLKTAQNPPVTLSPSPGGTPAQSTAPSLPAPVDPKTEELNKLGQKLFDINSQIEEEASKTDKASQEVIKDRQRELTNTRNQMMALKYNLKELPKPPELQNTQAKLGGIVPILTTLLAISAAFGKGDKSYNFATSYNAMVGSWKNNDFEDFIKKSQQFKQDLESARLQNDQELAKYKNAVDSLLAGHAIDKELSELRLQEIQMPLRNLLMMHDLYEKALKSQTDIFKTVNDAEYKKLMEEHKIREEDFNKQIKLLELGIKGQELEIKKKSLASASPSEFLGGEENANMAYERYVRFGTEPKFAYGNAGARQREAFYSGAYTWARNHGYDAQAMEIAKAQSGSFKKSLDMQEKSRGMMESFVLNIGKQVDRVEAISNEVGRYDTRLLNVPLRKIKMQVKGSSIESKISMYVTEISNEIGKISTGSQASIRELSENAQKKWEKIHDPNLSMKDLLDLLSETKEAARMRLESQAEGIDITKRRMGEIGVGNAPQKGSSGRIKVKSPNGQIGTIPDNQLESAMQQGYTQVK